MSVYIRNNNNNIITVYILTRTWHFMCVQQMAAGKPLRYGCCTGRRRRPEDARRRRYPGSTHSSYTRTRQHPLRTTCCCFAYDRPDHPSGKRNEKNKINNIITNTTAIHAGMITSRALMCSSAPPISRAPYTMHQSPRK